MSDSAPQALPFPPHDAPPTEGSDPELDRVEAWWRAQGQVRPRFGRVIRRTFDRVLDPKLTGRVDLNMLTATEQLYLLDSFRWHLRDEFLLPTNADSSELALVVDGLRTAIVFEPATGWQVSLLPKGALCLLVAASDDALTYDFGVVRLGDGSLEPAGETAALTDSALLRTRWLWRHMSFPANALRELPEKDRMAIFAMPGQKNGQERVNELFRRIQGKVIARGVLEAVAHQDDPMKRGRDSRKALRPEGIIVLGHQNDHPRIARELGLDEPRKGSLIAVRVVQATPQRQVGGRQVARMNDTNWVIALPDEPNEAGPESY